MSDANHILVVDDEPAVCAMIQQYLVKHGFAVSVADGGVAMREVLARRPVDLIVLDIRMPGENGLMLARDLRASSDKPAIIFLTASGETVDRIVGLEMGADDYLAKPFDPRELLARVRSVLKRYPSLEPQGGADEQEVRFGNCVLSLRARRLYTLDGAEVPLTPMELDMLQAFATHPNQVLSRDRLLDLAHKEWAPLDRSIDIRVGRLRQKIEPDPDKPTIIKTVRGAGYVFVPAGGGAR